MDRRQRKTKDAIFKAFIQLLSKKSYNNITVGEIIDLANVGRATFYAHFETKDFLLKELCVELFDHVFNANKSESANNLNIFNCEDKDGVFLHLFKHIKKNGTLTGKPFIAEIYNSTMRSKDYGDGVVLPRPAHADYVGYVKYGDKFDYRGGGKFSGRMTAPMCIAGGILKQLLKKQGITVNAYVKSIGSVVGMGYLDVDVENFDFSKIESEFPLLDESVRQDMLDLIKNVKTDLDSVGGTIECVIKGVKAGEGEFMFDSIESVISRLAFAVPAVKGIEFGLGFGFAKSNGSKVNDPFYYDEKGSVKTKTNFNAGINGGISNGNPITFRVVIKPTPSIAKEQDTINLKTGKNDKIKIVGRHDACIVPRAVSVIEAIASLAIYDIIK
jgi:chorismate synthase